MIYLISIYKEKERESVCVCVCVLNYKEAHNGVLLLTFTQNDKGNDYNDKE